MNECHCHSFRSLLSSVISLVPSTTPAVQPVSRFPSFRRHSFVALFFFFFLPFLLPIISPTVSSSRSSRFRRRMPYSSFSTPLNSSVTRLQRPLSQLLTFTSLALPSIRFALVLPRPPLVSCAVQRAVDPRVVVHSLVSPKGAEDPFLAFSSSQPSTI